MNADTRHSMQTLLPQLGGAELCNGCARLCMHLRYDVSTVARPSFHGLTITVSLIFRVLAIFGEALQTSYRVSLFGLVVMMPRGGQPPVVK